MKKIVKSTTETIKLAPSATRKVDLAKVAGRLGAKRYLSLRELTKEEAQEYEPMGGPYLMAVADAITILRNGSSMLQALGKSIDDVVGYRILDLDEEQEFRRRCAEESRNPDYFSMPMVRYYKKKK